MISIKQKSVEHNQSQEETMQNYLTSRIIVKEEMTSWNNVVVPPWSGEEYYNKLKKDIKSSTKRKKSEHFSSRFFPSREGCSR